MSKRGSACDKCGVVYTNLKQHRGKGPCLAKVEQNRIEAKGLVIVAPIESSNIGPLRVALERARVPTESAPAIYSATMSRGMFGRRKFEGKRQFALCAPPWVKWLYDDGAFDKAGPDVAVQRMVQMGEEFQRALETTGALGGQKAVTRLLRYEGFYENV